MVLDLLNPLAVLIDPVFSPLLIFKPHIAIFLFSLILTALIYGLNKLLVNKNVMKEIKEKLAAVKENMNKAQKEGKQDDVNRFLKEYMTINNQHLGQTFKVMIVSFLVLIVLFPWASRQFGSLAGIASLPFYLPFLGNNISWVLWYILVSVTGSWLLRKFIGE
ncbi:MAG: DUF106 domain-containing protein [Candidatus Aenigmarchaeota archaeon]|nr:DUF106 domain-containing protein [Candidatus Aenigmarchaeota archaeon]